MAKLRISLAFRARLSDKLMDVGKYAVAGLVIGQFATGVKISDSLLLLGISSAVILYIAGYVISS